MVSSLLIGRPADSLLYDDRASSMTKLDRVTRMPARTLLYGFLGAIAIASAVTFFGDPLDPTFGDESPNPRDWSVERLRSFLRENNVTYPENASRKDLVKLVRQQREAQTGPPGNSAATATTTTTTTSDTEQTPLLPTQVPLHSGQAENERLERASNLK